MMLTLNCVPHPCSEGLTDEALVELLAAHGVTE